jgi:hypothetical protein
MLSTGMQAALQAALDCKQPLAAACWQQTVATAKLEGYL